MLPLINAPRFGMTHSAEISTTTAFFLPSLHSRRQEKPRVRRTSCGFTKRFAGECGRQVSSLKISNVMRKQVIFPLSLIRQRVKAQLHKVH